jgi:proline dehydrogenase
MIEAGVTTARAIGRRAAFALATSDRVERAVLNTPPLRALAWRQATRYVAGLDEQAALASVHALGLAGLSASVDLFGENVTDAAQAEAVTARYIALAGLLDAGAGTYVSLDCSHVGLGHDLAGCRDRVQRIARALPDGCRLQLGAEESSRADAILDVARTAADDGHPIMVTVQANLRRSAADIEDLARAQIPVRLVKGAYVESTRVAYSWGAETDAAYIQLAQRLDELGADHSLATHDPALLRQLLATREHAAIEFLLRVRTDDAHRLAQEGHRVWIYVPYGERWFRYYARRVAESIGA